MLANYPILIKDGDKKGYGSNTYNTRPEESDNNYEKYTVVSGETLLEIAEKYNTTYQDIARLNNISNKNLIYPEEKLKIRYIGW